MSTKLRETLVLLLCLYIIIGQIASLVYHLRHCQDRWDDCHTWDEFVQHSGAYIIALFGRVLAWPYFIGWP